MHNLREEMEKLLCKEVFNELESESGNFFLRVTEPKNLTTDVSVTSGEGKLREFKIFVKEPEHFASITLDQEHIEARKQADESENVDSLHQNESDEYNKKPIVTKLFADLVKNFCNLFCNKNTLHSVKRNRNVSKSKFDNKFSWLVVDNHDHASMKCDLIIILYRYRKIYIILGELKSENLRLKKSKAQLKNSYLIMKYLVDLMRCYHNDRFISSKYCSIIFSNSKQIKEKHLDDKFDTHHGKRNKRLDRQYYSLPTQLKFFKVQNNSKEKIEEIFRYAFPYE